MKRTSEETSNCYRVGGICRTKPSPPRRPPVIATTQSLPIVYYAQPEPEQRTVPQQRRRSPPTRQLEVLDDDLSGSSSSEEISNGHYVDCIDCVYDDYDTTTQANVPLDYEHNEVVTYQLTDDTPNDNNDYGASYGQNYGTYNSGYETQPENIQLANKPNVHRRRMATWNSWGSSGSEYEEINEIFTTAAPTPRRVRQQRRRSNNRQHRREPVPQKQRIVHHYPSQNMGGWDSFSCYPSPCG